MLLQWSHSTLYYHSRGTLNRVLAAVVFCVGGLLAPPADAAVTVVPPDLRLQVIGNVPGCFPVETVPASHCFRKCSGYDFVLAVNACGLGRRRR